MIFRRILYPFNYTSEERALDFEPEEKERCDKFFDIFKDKNYIMSF
jgi:hypothetical protein